MEPARSPRPERFGTKGRATQRGAFTDILGTDVSGRDRKRLKHYLRRKRVQGARRERPAAPARPSVAPEPAQSGGRRSPSPSPARSEATSAVPRRRVRTASASLASTEMASPTVYYGGTDTVVPTIESGAPESDLATAESVTLEESKPRKRPRLGLRKPAKRVESADI